MSGMSEKTGGEGSAPLGKLNLVKKKREIKLFWWKKRKGTIGRQ